MTLKINFLILLVSENNKYCKESNFLEPKGKTWKFLLHFFL